MSLSIGARTGAYEILAALGAGAWARCFARAIRGSIAIGDQGAASRSRPKYHRTIVDFRPECDDGGALKNRPENVPVFLAMSGGASEFRDYNRAPDETLA